MLRKPLTIVPSLVVAALAFAHTAAASSFKVTMAPVGLSLEYPVMAQDLGAGACPPTALAAELLRLGSPPLALAGQSQDLTVPGEVPGEVPRNPTSSWEAATSYALPANFWSQLHCLLSASKDPLTVGINAKTGGLSWAAKVVAGAQSAATNGLDFSLGNEPDLYYLPNYSSLGKAQSPAAAVGVYLQVAAYLQQAVGSAPLVGPELATAEHWRAELPQIIAQLHERTVGVHQYPLSTCRSPSEVVVRGLLSSSAADAPRSLAWVVADADAAHLPAIISEANSASCGGKVGVSDRPAAGVWAVRFVLSALNTGFREVRFHFSGGPYDPFIVRGSEVIDRPLQSALVSLNQWLPIGASLRTVTSAPGLVRTAVTTPGGAVRLIFDNLNARAQQVVLRTARGARTEMLSAARAGVQTRTLRSTHGAVKLIVAGNAVLSVRSGP